MIDSPVRARWAHGRLHPGSRSAQMRQLLLLALMVILLALLAIGAAMHTAPSNGYGFVNGSFGTDQRADYGASLTQRIAPQRAIVRG